MAPKTFFAIVFTSVLSGVACDDKKKESDPPKEEKTENKRVGGRSGLPLGGGSTGGGENPSPTPTFTPVASPSPNPGETPSAGTGSLYPGACLSEENKLCALYLGFDESAVKSDCAEAGGKLVMGTQCVVESSIGQCVIGGDSRAIVVFVYPVDGVSKEERVRWAQEWCVTSDGIVRHWISQ